MGIGYGPSIITSGLVLALDAADRNSYPGSGTTWTDLSGLGNNGTLVNGVGYTSSNAGSLVFDGTNDYVNCGSSSSIKPTSQLTLSSWVYRNNWLDNDTEAPISCTEASGYEFYYASNTIRFYVYSNGTYKIPTFSTSSLTGWVHLIGTYDNRYANLYVNGILRDTVDSGGNHNITYVNNDIIIGGEASSGSIPQPGFYWTGNIAQALIYNRALTEAEIQQNFNATRSRYGI